MKFVSHYPNHERLQNVQGIQNASILLILMEGKSKFLLSAGWGREADFIKNYILACMRSHQVASIISSFNSLLERGWFACFSEHKRN